LSAAATAARRGRELASALLVAVLLAGYVRTFLVQPFAIQSDSMAPGVLVGDQLLVNRFVYGPCRWAWECRLLPLRSPRSGDVAFFRAPREPRRFYVKRVLGLPGATVTLRRGALSVDGRLVPESGYLHGTSPRADAGPLAAAPDFGPSRVPAASFLVLGDHRERSLDTRRWGFVPRRFVLGRALAIYWSWRPAAEEGGARVRWARLSRPVR
jgi:signal peptidase I